MDTEFEDYISNQPQGIIDTILTKMSLRDAVRTSVLSTRWRYKWVTLTQLQFDDTCVPETSDISLAKSKFVKFVNRFLLLHNGAISRFALCTSFLQNSHEVDQWLLVLSRKNVNELCLELGEGEEFFRVPSSLFSLRKLVRLDLVRCELDPPFSFRGFKYLKHLILQQILVDPEVLENFISGCALLENLNLSYIDILKLTIRAPNLKFLTLEGNFKDVCLKDTPKLLVVSVSIYMDDDIGQNSTCNFDKVLGDVPSLQRLVGHIYFTKFMSIGNSLRTTHMKYEQLKAIELYQVNFEEEKEVMVVLRLIINSPVLHELTISSSSNSSFAIEDPDLDIWENDLFYECTLEQLKKVKMTDMSGCPHEMRFIKFLLGSSPVLETLSITPTASMTEERLSFLIELLRFQRASPEVEIIFVQDQL